METKEACLAKSPLFEDLSEDKLSEIAQEAQPQIVPAHTIIFREGDVGENFYVINSGSVRLFKRGARGDEIGFAELGPGDFFGQLAILTDDLRWVNVEALQDTHLTVFSREQFDHILRQYPSASLAFAKQMSEYLARNIQVIRKKSEDRFRAFRTSWIDFFVIFCLSLLFGIIFNCANPNGIRLLPSFRVEEAIILASPAYALEKHGQGGALFVDARPSILYEQMHIAGSVSIPLAFFDIMYMMELQDIDKDREIIVYGRTVSRHYDEQVARKLFLRGYKHTMILKGGLPAWKKRGFPVEKTMNPNAC